MTTQESVLLLETESQNLLTDGFLEKQKKQEFNIYIILLLLLAILAGGSLSFYLSLL